MKILQSQWSSGMTPSHSQVAFPIWKDAREVVCSGNRTIARPRPGMPEHLESESLSFPNSLLFIDSTYLSCGDSRPDAIEARAERPGSCGSEALWCSTDGCVEVDDGRDIGSLGEKSFASSVE